MEKVDNGCRGATSLYFLSGLGAGIALTVLLAPRSGAATRRLIGSKVEGGKNWARDKAATAQNYVRERRDELVDRVKDKNEAAVIEQP